MRMLTSTFVICLALVAGSSWAEGPEDAAQEAAEKWLELVDQELYQESWSEAAELFKEALPQEEWAKTVARARRPLGAVVSRTLKSRMYTKELRGAPDGQYVVIQFHVVFEKKAAAVETITPMLDPDGVWRVSGYYIR